MTEEKLSSDPFVAQLVGEALHVWVHEVRSAWIRVWAEIVRDDGRGQMSQAPYGISDCIHDNKPCARCDPLGERARWIIRFVENVAEQAVLDDPRFDRLRKAVETFWELSESGKGETTGLAAEIVDQSVFGDDFCLTFDALVGELAFKVKANFCGLLTPEHREDALGHFREAHARRIRTPGLLERWNKLVDFPLEDLTSKAVCDSPSKRIKLPRPGVGRKRSKEKPKGKGRGLLVKNGSKKKAALRGKAGSGGGFAG